MGRALHSPKPRRGYGGTPWVGGREGRGTSPAIQRGWSTQKPLPDVLTRGKINSGGADGISLTWGFLCSAAAATATSPPSSPTCTRAASSLCQRPRAAASSRGTRWTWGWQQQVRLGHLLLPCGCVFPPLPFAPLSVRFPVVFSVCVTL